MSADCCFIHTRWSRDCDDCPATRCYTCGGRLPVGASYYHICAIAQPSQTHVMTMVEWPVTR